MASVTVAAGASTGSAAGPVSTTVPSACPDALVPMARTAGAGVPAEAATT